METVLMSPALLEGLLTARSLARGAPFPVPDRGGFRIDTNRAEERRRWVFPTVSDGLLTLAAEIDQPRHFLKVCVSDERLREVLPARWDVAPCHYVMVAGRPAAPRRLLPPTYTLEYGWRREGVVEARICTLDGGYAASGYAAESGRAFFYDRIETIPQHRRRGLGTVIMEALRARKSESACELLISTSEGRALYESLGWIVVCPYSTASLPD